MQLLEPSTIEAIGFRTPRDIFGVARMNKGDLTASGLKDVKQGNPVTPVDSIPTVVTRQVANQSAS